MKIRREKNGSHKDAFIIIIVFTAAYAACMGLRVFYFMKAGRSMICEADALEQHINALIAYGKWLRGIAYTLIHEHRLAFMDYSFGIGMGADFYTSMQYYAVGDPLNLPVAFLPSQAVYYYFQFLILLRPYLAGLAFIALCLYRRSKRELPAMGITAGALIYSLSGTVLFIGMWNPFFVTPMITLPLMVRGADRLYHEGMRAPFVLAVFAAGVSNFYFFYMQTIFIFGYFILLVLYGRKDEGEAYGRECGAPRLFARFVLSGALGVFMGAVLLFPMFLALLSNPRSGGHAIPFIYDSDYYLQLVRNLAFYIYHPLYDTELSLTLIAFPVIILTVIFAKKWGLKRERAEFLVLLLMLLIPAAGYVMSGFAYVINRWCFAAALLIAWLTAATWDRWLKKKLASCLAFACVFVMLIWNVWEADSPERGNLPNGFLEKMSGTEFLDRMMLTEVNALRETVLVSPDSFSRYSGRSPVWNASLLHGISSTQFYWSLTNGAVADLFGELAVNDMANFSYLGFDDRMMASDLSGVTHYTLRYDTPEEQSYIPAGSVRAAEYYNFAIYENALPVGMGTVYPEFMRKSDYLTLAPYDREEAMMRAVVLDDVSADAAEDDGVLSAGADDISFSSLREDFEIITAEGVRWEPEGEGGRFVVDRDGGVDVILRVDNSHYPEEGAETGLLIMGLDIEEGPADIVNIGTGALNAGGADVDPLEASEDPGSWSARKIVSYKTPESEFYSGWHDYLVNLGSAAGPYDLIFVDFPAKGVYSVKDLGICVRPAGETFDEMRETLAAHAVTETDLHRNPVSLMTERVLLTASSPEDEPGVMMLTIPWQKGWSAKVDGEKTGLFRTNTAFTGLILGPGYHEIELEYHTPGLAAGVVMSLLGVACFSCLVICEKKRRDEEKQ